MGEISLVVLQIGVLREVDYTEERARFFVELFKGLCRLANMVTKFEEPEDMIKLIESGNYLMSDNQQNK